MIAEFYCEKGAHNKCDREQGLYKYSLLKTIARRWSFLNSHPIRFQPTTASLLVFHRECLLFPIGIISRLAMGHMLPVMAAMAPFQDLYKSSKSIDPKQLNRLSKSRIDATDWRNAEIILFSKINSIGFIFGKFIYKFEKAL